MKSYQKCNKKFREKKTGCTAHVPDIEQVTQSLGISDQYTKGAPIK